MKLAISGLSRFDKPTGICKHAANIVKSLLSFGQVEQITLILGEWQTSYFDKAFGLRASGKVNIHPIAIENRSLTRNQWFVSGLPRLVRSLGSDILHLAFPVPILRPYQNVQVVTTIHDLYPYDYPENFGFPNYYFNRLFLRMNVANSDAFVCVSKSTTDRARDLFRRSFGRKKNVTIYNAADFTGVEASRPAFAGDGSRFILTVGQHRKNKNLDILLRGFALLRASGRIGSDYRLFIVGGVGPETESLKQLVQTLNLGAVVVFGSSLTEAELSWVYSRCELFVSTSSIEGFCMPLVEARRLAPRIVCSDIPIFRELAGSSAKLFSLAGNAGQNLSDALAESLAQPPLPKVDDLSEFSLDQIGRQYVSLYASLTARA